MTNRIPGFIWHPIDVGNRARRIKGRGAVGHVAVSNSATLVPSGTAATRSADWHWYNPKVGPGIQFIDLDLQCWASAAGNRTLVAFESQGGMGTTAQVNAEPWNDNQLENAARFYAYGVESEGWPLQVMPDSRAASRGLAGHRLGIDPWRVSGGEVWSSSRGKLCPGDAKMAQLPVVVSRASEIVHGSPTPTLGGFLMALTDTEQAELRDKVRSIFTSLQSGDTLGGLDNIALIYWMLKGGDAGTDPSLTPNNFGWLHDEITKAVQAATADIKAKLGQAQAPSVDEAKLAAALLSNADAVAKLGDAIAAGLASRVHNG